MAGRPPKSMAIHEITGAKQKNPGRFKDRQPEPETPGGLGDPPAEFAGDYGDNPKLRALWVKIAAEAPIGVLTASDREYVAKTCRVGIEAGRTASKGYLRALEMYGRMLKGIGMTPEGRAIRGIGGKAAPTTSKATNPLDDFTKGAKRAS